MSSVSKSELANSYKISLSTLSNWLETPLLKNELVKAGYRKGQKLLTPRQVEIIKKYLG